MKYKIVLYHSEEGITVGVPALPKLKCRCNYEQIQV